MRRLNGLALVLATSALVAMGPDDGSRAWIQIQGGLVTQPSSSGIGSEPGFGLGLGWQSTGLWGWEASLLEASLKGQTGHWKARETHLDGSILLDPFVPSGAWRPFLRAGVGGSSLHSPLSLSLRSSTRLNLVAGLGTQYLFGGRGLGTLELRSMSVRSSVPRTEVQFLLGLGWRWGTHTGPGPMAPADRPFPGPGPEPWVQPLPAPGPGPWVRPVPGSDQVPIHRDPAPEQGQGPWVRPVDPEPGPKVIQPAP